MQTSLLDSAAAVDIERLVLPDAELLYIPAFYTPSRSASYFQQLMLETPWQQDYVNFGGKKIAVPRLQAWYGDSHAHYGYSGLRLTPLPWTPLLDKLRSELSDRLQLPFNSVLLNHYRNGNDSVAWHSDNEKQLGTDPMIASLSFGATRRFELKHKTRRELGKTSLGLGDGSLIVMGKGVQKHWIHQIPKQPAITVPRLNLTFRFIHGMA